jgi:hypothetical protein
MPKTGIAARVWRETETQTGFKPAPALSGYAARIYQTKEGVNKNNDPYLNIFCELAHEELEKGIKHTEYYALTEERLGFLKGFLRGIGRADLCRSDADWDELVDTEFVCDIRHQTGKNETVYANIDLNTIEAQSHEFFEVPEEQEEAEEEPEPPKATPKAGGGARPQRSPRSRVDR